MSPNPWRKPVGLVEWNSGTNLMTNAFERRAQTRSVLVPATGACARLAAEHARKEAEQAVTSLWLELDVGVSDS